MNPLRCRVERVADSGAMISRNAFRDKGFPGPGGGSKCSVVAEDWGSPTAKALRRISDKSGAPALNMSRQGRTLVARESLQQIFSLLRIEAGSSANKGNNAQSS